MPSVSALPQGDGLLDSAPGAAHLAGPFRWSASVCALLAAGLCLTVLTGWTTGWTVLAGFGRGLLPMAPSTALLGLLLAAALLLGPWRSRLGAAISLAVAAAGLTLFAQWTIQAGDVEQWLVPARPFSRSVFTGRMSPLTAASLFALGVALFLALLRRRTSSAAGAAALLATATGLVGLVAVDGYANLNPFLYGGTVTPVALPTALAMVFLAAGVVAAAGPSARPTRAFVGPSVRARLLRVLIPFIPAMLLVEGVSRQATGYFTSFNPAIDHALVMLAFTALGLGIAARLSTHVDRVVVAARRALEEREEQYRVVTESATEGIITINHEGIITAWNGGAERMFGYSGEEILGRPLEPLIPEGCRGRHRDWITLLEPGTEPRPLGRTMTVEALRKNGEAFPIELSLSASETPRGRFLTGIIRDISERHRAERFQAMGLAVAGVLAEATTLDEATPRVLEEICLGADWDLVEMWVADGDDLGWRGSWHRPEIEASPFVAASREMPVGRSGGLAGKAWREGQPVWDEDVLGNAAFMRAEAAGAAGLHGALACPLRGEAPVGVLACFSRAPRPRDDRLLAVMQDVTQRVGHFVERQRAAEVLRQSEAQVRQLQRLESVGRLAGGVAHDFNNLLTVILGRSQLLLARAQLDDRARADITLIQQTGERASALTRQLLAFSRTQVLEPRVLDISDIVSGLVGMLRRLIGEDIDLAFRPGPALGRVNADPGQLEQVLVNLVVNARDAMPKGGQVTIETANADLDQRYARQHPGAQPGSYVMLAVSDTGIGMDAETQARVFEPFFTTKEAGKGTGLGLSTVYGIVKQSGGHIFVYSEPGRGTVFKIYLPRVEEPLAQEEPVVSTPPRGTETVLLVEDEDEVRELVREMLEGDGYTVVAARQPAEALEIADQSTGAIHLLLTDVVMPQMAGPQLAETLTAQCRGMKVLYMSGYTADALGRSGVLTPGTSLIHKPFTLSALAGKVREVLDAGPQPEPRRG
ncbi:MAG: PAS domain S-box protein [Candidatus Rokubacteria bacterium]|nr:PAS domain S-box protein [Candidatus Rokubacteria bacterium]